MKIKTVVVGPLETNCYIIENETECIIIDPGSDPDIIIKNVMKKVVGIIITHNHFDHIGARDDIKAYYKCKCYSRANMSEGENKIGSFHFNVIYTPGHEPNQIVIYFKEEKVMFVGDFIFKNSIGRTDLQGGSWPDMKKSIQKILEYPRETTIYPGHYASTTLDAEYANLKDLVHRY